MLGDIAGLIAAVAFAGLVVALAVPLIKLGRSFDALTKGIEELTDHTTPILDESARTVSEANVQLERVDTITTAASETAQNVSALTGLYAAVLGRPLVKVAAFSYGVRRAFGKRSGRADASAARPKPFTRTKPATPQNPTPPTSASADYQQEA